MDLSSVAKNENPVFLLGKKFDQIIEIYFQINHLKQLYRRGWLRKKRVTEMDCESVADHCFGMLILAWLIIEKYQLEFDSLKVFKLIIAHEFGEVYGGDMTPVDGISDEGKYRIEKDSVLEIFRDFPGRDAYVEIWEEYAAKETEEAVFVAQIDKLEMAFQGVIYQLQHKKDFSSFIDSAEKAISDEVLIDFLKELREI